MTLKQLAEKFHALEAIDKAPFQRSARILQSIWRDEQGFPADDIFAFCIHITGVKCQTNS